MKEELQSFAAYFFGVPITGLSFILFLCSIPHLLLVFFAPKVFLIQEIAKMIK